MFVVAAGPRGFLTHLASLLPEAQVRMAWGKKCTVGMVGAPDAVANALRRIQSRWPNATIVVWPGAHGRLQARVVVTRPRGWDQ